MVYAESISYGIEDTKSSYYAGLNSGLIFAITILVVPNTWVIVGLSVISFLVRVLILRYEFFEHMLNFALLLMIIIAVYISENARKKFFKEFIQNRDALLKFQNFVKTDLEDGLLIIDLAKNTLFENAHFAPIKILQDELGLDGLFEKFEIKNVLTRKNDEFVDSQGDAVGSQSLSSENEVKNMKQLIDQIIMVKK